MPLYKTIVVNQNTTLYVWKIEESFDDLIANIILSTKSEQRLLSMKSQVHQKGFLSIRQLLKIAGYNDFDLYYTPNGKPHLKTGEKISITHSFNFAAIIISDVEVGIDIEKNRDKIKIIQNKFVNLERGFLNQNDDLVEQLTVIWGAKESLYKIYPYGGLTFKNDIDILPFNLCDKKTTGYIKVDNWDKDYIVFFEQIENFTLVYALEKEKMAKSVLKSIQKASKKGKKLLAVLLDPDKVAIANIASISNKIAALNAHFIFVGGSIVASGLTALFVVELKKYTQLPIILFPGDYTQLTNKAQAVLFLSLISGRNPEYLIEQQIKAVPFLQNSSLEIIPTGYILIDGGNQSSVLKVSNTLPIDQNNIELIVATAKAGEYKGKKLIYLEAGSGAAIAVDPKIIAAVKKQVSIPIIVGGGIKTKQQMLDAFNSGADLVVIGTAVEHNLESLNTFVS